MGRPKKQTIKNQQKNRKPSISQIEQQSTISKKINIENQQLIFNQNFEQEISNQANQGVYNEQLDISTSSQQQIKKPIQQDILRSQNMSFQIKIEDVENQMQNVIPQNKPSNHLAQDLQYQTNQNPMNMIYINDNNSNDSNDIGINEIKIGNQGKKTKQNANTKLRIYKQQQKKINQNQKKILFDSESMNDSQNNSEDWDNLLSFDIKKTKKQEEEELFIKKKEEELLIKKKEKEKEKQKEKVVNNQLQCTVHQSSECLIYDLLFNNQHNINACQKNHHNNQYLCSEASNNWKNECPLCKQDLVQISANEVELLKEHKLNCVHCLEQITKETFCNHILEQFKDCKIEPLEKVENPQNCLKFKDYFEVLYMKVKLNENNSKNIKLKDVIQKKNQEIIDDYNYIQDIYWSNNVEFMFKKAKTDVFTIKFPQIHKKLYVSIKEINQIIISDQEEEEDDLEQNEDESSDNSSNVMFQRSQQLFRIQINN